MSEGSKSARAEAARDTWSWGGPVPRSFSASCVVWGLKLGTLSTTNCALVPFMNIHPGAFRPRLISREIDEETRTFYHKRSVSPSPSTSSSSSSSVAFSGGCWQNSPSSLAKKKEREKSYLKSTGRFGLQNGWANRAFFLPIAYLVPITHVYQKQKEKKLETKYNYLIE